MANYKQPCADLVDALTAHGQPDDDAVGYVAGLLTRARAALAQPEPEGPTHEEVCDLMHEFTIGTGHGERLDEIGFAYALLARWGK